MKRKLSYNLTLDLHGYNAEDAISSLETAIANAYKKNVNYVDIVYGKGLGILKREILSYLNNGFANRFITTIQLGEKHDLPGGEGMCRVLMKVNAMPITGRNVKPKSISELINNTLSEYEKNNIIRSELDEKKKKGKEKYLKRMNRKVNK